MKTRKEVSSGGIVFKKNGDKTLWLITQHSQGKHWSFPKGLVGDSNENENTEAAALREVSEEGGIKAKIVFEKPIAVNYNYRFNQDLVKKTVYYYLMEYISGDPMNHDWEVSEAKFVSEDKVEKIITYQTDKSAFSQILLIFKSLK